MTDPAKIRAYEVKFENFLRMIEASIAEGIDKVLVPDPVTLGDNYEEMIESLSRLADAGMSLHIVKRSEL